MSKSSLPEDTANADEALNARRPPSVTSDMSGKDKENELHLPSDPEKAVSQTSIIVDWDGPNDPGNPVNMSKARKWLITISLSLTNFTTTFASSVFSSANGQTARLFHVSEEVMVLGTSLYLCGFIFGPCIFGYALRTYAVLTLLTILQAHE